jgi:phosphate transport system permease protein
MPATLESPPLASSPLLRSKSISRRVKLIDRTANLLIRAGGAGIIIIVALIFVFIGLETVPLFRPATQTPVFTAPLPGATPQTQVQVLGVDEYESHIYYLDAATGELRFFTTSDDRKVVLTLPLTKLGAARAASAYRTPSRDKLVVGTSDGRILFAEASFTPSYAPDDTRTVAAKAREVGEITLFSNQAAVRHVHLRADSNGALHYVASAEDGQLVAGKFVEDEPAEDPIVIDGAIAGKITALVTDYESDRVLVATDAKKLYQWFLSHDSEAPFREYDLPSVVTAMDYAIGDVAVLLGFESGAIESWFGVRENADDFRRPLRRIHAFEPLPAAVTYLQPSGRDKGFVVGDRGGTVQLKFTTSERTMLTYDLDASIAHLAYAPKLTSLVALSSENRLDFRAIHNPHPEISLKTLFGKVHYEGYDSPDYIWQSTGGTDDFESKFSLVPLTIGTLKGAFYGLLFAIPIAVMAALYTSQLMAPRLRAYFKPTVEIMAALPSVVIGFLAGLWLAPLLEDIMVGTLLGLIMIPLTILVGAAIWSTLPAALRLKVKPGVELIAVFPLVLLGFWLAQQLGPSVEAMLFGGNYRQWVFETFGQQFEQRNSLVIGIAMGFAVIPIIFTISEDAFSNVPTSFRSASYALGASKWQTAWRVILPTASPGVFSAVMIGFGRAVGETMIVLMATGNTPILSFSPFNGMRTLSANIAVEIPEAPAGGTLYRVLFVAALLLFALTFACNTVAEVVRQRLRQKYQAV